MDADLDRNQTAPGFQAGANLISFYFEWILFFAMNMRLTDFFHFA